MNAIMHFLRISPYFTLLLLTLNDLSISAATLKGRITDSKTKEPLVGVNVISGTNLSTITDTAGNYELKVEKGSYTFSFSYVGYQTITRQFTIEDADMQADISLTEELRNVLGDELVVTGSLFQKKASEEVISIEIIQPKLIQNTNVTRIDEVMRRVSGVNVVDGQANIRSGSGWAYGVGSRVMMILDGQTILSPDRGDTKWSLLPIETIGQIEILKGASSVLYGSSAMNGTIHLQTIVPKKKPLTRFTAFTSFIAPPIRKETKWWGDFPLMSIGTSFMRAHKVTNHFEYVVGGTLFLQNQHYQDGLEYLGRITYRTKWTSKKNERFSWGIAGNMMYNRETEFFYWQNQHEGSLKPGANNIFSNFRLTFDPYATLYDKKGNKHEILTRTYYNQISFGTSTLLENIDYRFTRQWREKELTVISGIDEQFLWIKVPEFVSGAKKTGNLLAGYVQVDKKYKNLTLSAGVRFESFVFQNKAGITGLEFRDGNGKLKFYLPGQWRAGLNYQATKKASIRFNIGQAYRFPSFAERYVNQSVGVTGDKATLAILPNLDLVPEYGWTSEIGYQQKFGSKGKKYFGLLDFAFFWQEYKNLVDFSVNLSDTTVNAVVKLRAENISNARIAGIDMSVKHSITHNKHVLNIMTGYNYSLPIEVDKYLGYNLNNVGSYLGAFFKYMFHPITGDTASYVLKYRNRHLLTFDAEYVYDNKLTLGMDVRYYSNQENFDKLFLAIPGTGYDEYYKSMPKKGYWIVNARAFYTLKDKHTFGFIVKNMLNKEYWLRVGKLESPMSFTLQYRYEF
jgi:outer membrane receptor protein involved in Fe transport